MQHRLYGLRGQAYVAGYNSLYNQLKEAIKKDFFEIVEKPGNFTPKNLGELCNKYQIPVKVMDEWLPDITMEEKDRQDKFYPTGTWERCTERGIKARDIGVVWN